MIGENELKNFIRKIADFPKKGIIFRDITPLIQNKEAFKMAIDLFYEKYKNNGIEKIASVEARGYIFAGALAYRLNAGVVILRKPGKLPYKTIREEYELEYGKNAIEMHCDAINKDEKVLVFDDLLATGGTALAACKLVEKVGGKVIGVAFLIELTELKGREKLSNYEVFSIIK